jgi:hypothetical protein
MSVSHLLAGERIEYRDYEKADAIGDHQEIKHGGTLVNLTHNGGAQNVGEILTTAATKPKYRVNGTCSRVFRSATAFTMRRRRIASDMTDAPTAVKIRAILVTSDIKTP